MDEQTHEVNPPRDALEALISRVSLVSTIPNDGGRGGLRPESVPEIAGRVAGIEARNGYVRDTAEQLFWAYLDDRSRARLVDSLDSWGRQRILFRCPDVPVSGNQHRRIVRCMVDGVIGTESRRQRDRARASGLGDRKIRALMRHIASLDALLDEARSVLYEHLRRQNRGDRHLDDHLNESKIA